ncbi:hypothetical protein HK099_001295 [Clydaea vesicula]|uniref:protein xylosyltransferase n=1 Tax=Clydaea vesicula TaxID=447962 RepID=A0AAD5XXA0_9FUNG|nr:hypothetical protein HK099_001295 [Clydaea vesicula]KAJ3392050.1 hypothetical protein HDU92_008648 [Lobulomyces angularis]
MLEKRKTSKRLLIFLLSIYFGYTYFQYFPSYNTQKFKIKSQPVAVKEKVNDDGLKIYNFNYCESFDGSVMNKSIYLNSGSSKYFYSPNPAAGTDIQIQSLTEEDLTQIIDSVAIEICQLMPLHLEFEKINFFSCFTALMGATGFSDISEDPILKELSNSHFYNWIQETPRNEMKSIFKLAYYITINRIEDIPNLKFLISAIYTPETIILIHVDEVSGTLLKILKEYVDILRSEQKSISIKSHGFKIHLKTSSVIKAQLLGFFELYDLGSWDYLINLSANDYPVKSSAGIYQILMQNSDKVWISYDKDEKMKSNLEVPCFAVSCFWGTRRVSKFLDQFPSTKNSPWGFFPRQFIKEIRNSKSLPMLLAWVENSWAPVESFLSILTLSNESAWKNRVINSNKRFKLGKNETFAQLKLEMASENAFFLEDVYINRNIEVKHFADNLQSKSVSQNLVEA